MALEDLTGPNKFITALVNTNPLSADDRREGDDHIRGIKNVLHNTFPNLDAQVTATPAALNDAGKAVLRTGDTMTGTLAVADGGEVQVSNSSGADRAYVALAMKGTAAAPVPTLWTGKAGAGAAPTQFNFGGAPRYVFDTEVHAYGVSGGFVVDGNFQVGGNYWSNALSANPNWGPLTLRGLLVPGDRACWRMGGPEPAYIDFTMSGNDAHIIVGGSGGATMVQAARFAGKADSAGYADNAGYSNNSGQLQGMGPASFVYADGANYAGFISGGTTPYLRRTADGGVYRLATLQNIGRQTFDGQVNFNADIACRGNSAHTYNWFWNGDAGDAHLYAYVDGSNQGWATLNSDERLKEDIQPLESDEAAFMRLAPINFKWRKVGPITKNERRNDGLSAQNVRACFPLSAFGDFETPPKEDGTMEFPGAVDDRGVLAHTILRVQDLIRRVAELERLLAAAGA